MNSVKKNFIYNIIYQILILIIPLITAPYLARVVGAAGVGTYSYTYSIVYYFMLLTMLGVNNYGNRTIAKVRDNKEKISKSFWSIYLLQLFIGILMLLLYFLYLMLFDVKYKSIVVIQSLYIISAILDIKGAQHLCHRVMGIVCYSIRCSFTSPGSLATLCRLVD